MRRILLIGPDFHCYTENLKIAFENAGDSVEMVVCQVSGGILSRLSDKNRIRAFNQSILAAIRARNYDVVICVRGAYLYDDTLKVINQQNIPCILFLQDTLANSGTAAEQIAFYKKVLLFDMSDKEKLVNSGVNAIYCGTPVSIQNYYPIENIVRDVDICFVGRLFDSRVSLLEEIVESFPNKNIVIAGDYLPGFNPARWGRFYKYYLNGYSRCFLDRNMSYVDVNKLYNRSKICLNIQHPQGIWSCGTRTMEIMAAKSFQISSANPFMEKYLVGNGVILYDTASDLNQKIAYYLDRQEERDACSAHGYQYALQHSYEAKMPLFNL